MFKKLLEQLKNLFKTKAPKEILDNPIASKTVDNLFKEAEEAAVVLDKAADDIEKIAVEAVKEVRKKKGRPAGSTSTAKKKAPSKKTDK